MDTKFLRTHFVQAIFISLVFVNTLGNISCKKDMLPKATDVGANTFGCKINGLDFTPNVNSGYGGPALYGGIIENGTNGYYAYVSGRNTTITPEIAIDIHIERFDGPGRYDLNSGDRYGICRKYFPDKYYMSQLTRKGSVNISKDDRSARILSGTFEFIAKNQNNLSDSVVVTKGRFDIKY